MEKCVHEKKIASKFKMSSMYIFFARISGTSSDTLTRLGVAELHYSRT